MKRHFTPEELDSARDNPSFLAELISASGGYVLQKMKTAGREPSLETLLACASADSVMFILDNHELTREQQRLIAPFFRRSMGNKRLRGADLTEEQVDEILLAKEPLVAGVKLTLRQFKAFPALINHQFELDEYEADRILRASVADFSVEGFLSLDRAFLKTNRGVFNADSRLMLDPRGRELYKELSLERDAELGQAPSWSSFSRWPFKAEDESFLWELLDEASQESSRHLRLSYADVSSNPSVKAMVSELEFFKRVNPRDLSVFSDQEVEEHKILIQDAWLAELAKERHGGGIAELLQFSATPGQLELVADEAFLGRAIQQGMDFKFDSLWQEDADSLAKISLLRQKIARALLSGSAGSDESIDAYDVTRLIKSLTGRASRAERTAESLALANDLVERFLPLFTHSLHEGAYSAIASRFDPWIQAETLDRFEQVAKARPTPNLFCMALNHWSQLGEKRKNDRSNSAYQKRVESLCKTLRGSIDRKSADALCLAFKFPGRPFSWKPSFLWKPAPAVSTVETDFLKADYQRLYELPEGLQSLLKHYDPHYFKKLAELKTPVDERTLVDLLRSELPERIALIKKLVARAPKELIAGYGDYRKALRASPDGSLIEPMDQREKERDLFETAVERLRDLDAAKDALRLNQQLIDALAPQRTDDAYYDDEDDEEEGDELNDPRLVKLTEAKAELEAKALERRSAARAALDQLSYEHLQEQRKNALERHDYALFSGLSEVSPDKSSQELFASSLRSLGAETFAGLVRSDPVFTAYIRGCSGYNEETSIRLNFGSNAANTLALEALMEAWTPREPLRALAMFDREALAPIVNELAVRRFPELIVYSYRLTPSKQSAGGSSRDYVERPYTNEQLIRMYDAMEASGSFFCDRDVNARFSHFFCANFEDDQPRFLDFLKLAKTRPKLYCALTDYQLLCDMFPPPANETREERTTRACQRMRAFIDHFEWAPLMEGVALICEDLERFENNDRFSPKLAGSAIQSVIWSTYHDPSDANGNTVYRSDLSDEKSRELLKNLYDNGSGFLYSTRVCGSIVSVADYIEVNGGELFGEDAVEKILLPMNARKSEYFSLDKAYDKPEPIIKGLLNWLLSEGRNEDMQFIDWLVKQREFRDNELDYSHRHTSWERGPGGRNMAVLDHLIESKPLRDLLSVGMERFEITQAVGENATRRRRSMRM